MIILHMTLETNPMKVSITYFLLLSLGLLTISTNNTHYFYQNLSFFVHQANNFHFNVPISLSFDLLLQLKYEDLLFMHSIQIHFHPKGGVVLPSKLLSNHWLWNLRISNFFDEAQEQTQFHHLNRQKVWVQMEKIQPN